MNEVRKHVPVSCALTLSATCSSSLNAIGLGYAMLSARKYQQIVIAGYEDISRFIYNSLDAIKVLSHSSIKPFDENRDGLILGAGAGAIVLEEYTSAKARNATIFAEISGYRSLNGMATYMQDEALVKAIVHCLQYERRNLKEEVALMLCANGTKRNDRNLNEALQRMYDGENIPLIMNIKSLIGHCLGASGIMECVASCLCLYHGIVLPLYGIEKCEYSLPYLRERQEKMLKSVSILNIGFCNNVSSINLISGEK
jgi:3-oxoacyl-(acyl-carrier-protein) synthase